MPRKGDAELIKEIRDTYKRYVQAWSSTREQGKLDMKALSVDGPWPEDELRARRDKDNPRPTPHDDIISQNNDRVKNQARLNKRGMEVTPRGKAANKEKAALREDRMRQIQFEEKASRARMTAFDSAVDRGYGFYGIDTDFIGEKSFNQKITYRRFPNPDAVLVDPDCKEADFSDMRGAFVIDRMPTKDFEREYPGREKKSFVAEDVKDIPEWIDAHSVQVAEYWCVKKEKTRLLMIDDGSPNKLEISEEELKERFPDAELDDQTVILEPGAPAMPIVQERTSEKRKVMKYVTNGIEILERSPWLGSTIPIMTIVGKEKWEDGKRVLESKTRKQRSPQMQYDLATAGEYESLAMMPKVKWLGYEGQFETSTDWKTIHRNPVAYAEVKATIEGLGADKPLPLPTFINYSPDISAYEIAKESAMRAAMNAAGMPSAEIKDRSSKSGVAQQKMDEAADIASYHFVDNLDVGMEYEFQVINELLDKIEDSEREVGIRKADDTFDIVQLQPRMDESGKVIDHPYDDGDMYSVNLRPGRDYLSQKERAKEIVSMLLENYPAVAPLAIELENVGPLGDKIVKVLKALLPPEVRAAYDEGQGQEPQIPPEVAQQLQQYEGALDDAMKQIEQLQSGLKVKEIEMQGKVEIEKAKMDHSRALEEIRASLEKEKLSLQKYIAELNSKTTLIKTAEEIDSKEKIAQMQDDRAEAHQRQADSNSDRDSQERDKDRQAQSENQS